MSKKRNIDYEIKLKSVLEYKEGNKSLLDISKDINVSREQIRRWVHKYESFGVDGLNEKTKHKLYSKETKLSAIKDYISGEYSQFGICTKYEIASVSVPL